MIGIRHSDIGKDPSTFSLTIKGSGVYLTDPQYKDLPFVADHLDEYENEPVYAVYFKWGSQIAMLGSQTGVTAFAASDVVWWPTAARVGINTTKPATWRWNSINAAPISYSGAGNRIPAATSSTTNGTGDPCSLVDDGTRYGTLSNPVAWMMPTGKPWTTTEYINNTNHPFGTYARDDAGTFPSTNEASWSIMRNSTYNAKTDWTPHPKYPGAISDDKTFFLPATGWRTGGSSTSSNNDGNGTMESIVNGVATTAGYWTSSSTTGNTSQDYETAFAFCMVFNSSVMSPSKDLWRTWALPIRCVPVPNQ